METTDFTDWGNMMQPLSLDSYFEKVFGLSLSTDFIQQEILSVSDFFGLAAPAAVTQQSGFGPAFVYLNDPYNDRDDVVGYDLESIKDYRIHDRDSFRFLMGHEAAHRYLQNNFYPFINQWETELACDFLSSVRACIEIFNSYTFAEVVSGLPQGVNHPPGTWRKDIMDYAQQVAGEFNATGNFNLHNCMRKFTEYLNMNRQVIHNEFLKEYNKHQYGAGQVYRSAVDPSAGIDIANDIGMNTF